MCLGAGEVDRDRWLPFALVLLKKVGLALLAPFLELGRPATMTDL